MHIGAHVSIAKSLALAPGRSADMGGEVFQIFSRSPRGGAPPPITGETAAAFKVEMKKHGQHACYIHTPYFINFASVKSAIRYGSISVVRQELERGTQIGARAVMTHLGSAKDYGRKKAIEKVIRSVQDVLEGYKGTTLFLLEQSAGAGGEDGIIGGTLEELAEILGGAEKIDRNYKKYLGICVDTCHAWAMGYDLSSTVHIDKFITLFDKVIGIERLQLIHANDSKFALGGHKDRHEHIGRGMIGAEGFRALAKHPLLQHLDMIVETPTQEGMVQDIAFFKKQRQGISASGRKMRQG